MTVRIEYDDSLEQKVRFRISAAWELCFALHCLAFPECHDPQRAWIERTVGALPAGLLQSIERFGKGPSDKWWGATALLSKDCFAPFERELSRAKGLSADSIITILDEDSEMYTHTLDRELSSVQAVRSDPIAWRDHVCDVLEGFWPYFAPTWNTLERAFSREVVRIQRLLLSGQPIHQILPQLAPHYAWDAVQREIVVATTMESHLVGMSLDSIDIVPSYFSIPHQVVDTDRNLGLVTWMPSALVEVDKIDEEKVAAAFKLLGNGTRLAIYRRLIGRPRSAHELSQELGVSAATVARHTGLLAEAGMIRRMGSGPSGTYAKFTADRDKAMRLVEDVDWLAAGQESGAR